MLNTLRRWLRRRTFRVGATVSRFVARDVRRDVLVLSVSRIDAGLITCRVRTTNVLYVAKGLTPQPEFGPPTEVRVDALWHWTGANWGGLPDGASLADPDAHRYLEPWEALEPGNNFHTELQREAPTTHVLSKATIRAIARRGDRDDFLFRVMDREFSLAVVHLTWNRETDPKWPHTELFRDWEDFKVTRHDPDVTEWNELIARDESGAGLTNQRPRDDAT
jgi:hypothetical protein